MKFKLYAMILVMIFLSQCKKDSGSPTSPDSNAAPQLAAVGDQTVKAGETLNVSLSATDSNGDSMTFSISENPGFLSLTGASQSGNTASATLVIAPGQAISGTQNATIKVSDGKGGEDSESFSINVTAAEQGVWLEYWSGPQPSRFKLGLVQFYSVRFTKPAGWGSLAVEKVKIIYADSGQSINLCLWKNTSFQNGDYWPSGGPLRSGVKMVQLGANTWDVTALNWTTSNNQFFVGFEQTGGTVTLTGDGNNHPENRSYRMNTGKSWEKEFGFMANYCISIYVTQR